MLQLNNAGVILELSFFPPKYITPNVSNNESNVSNKHLTILCSLRFLGLWLIDIHHRLQVCQNILLRTKTATVK